MKDRLIRNTLLIIPPLLIGGSVLLFLLLPGFKKPGVQRTPEWIAPDISTLPVTEENSLIRYGEKLISHTSSFLGPKGRVASISNGLNCQNCHLDAGTRAYGNSFALVNSSYPRYRARSGKNETVEFRINECMERSLNGFSLDSNSKEMKAMVAYIKWVGGSVKKDQKPAGTGANKVEYLNRAADPSRGQQVFMAKCESCHGTNGEGKYNYDSSLFIYPPLWGDKSYNVSAGMFRLSQLAGFIKYNMPFDKQTTSPELTDEECWDLAAFINSKPRSEKMFVRDWPDIKGKPIDYPFGPYPDEFSELQHKYGPYQPILAARSINKNQNK